MRAAAPVCHCWQKQKLSAGAESSPQLYLFNLSEHWSGNLSLRGQNALATRTCRGQHCTHTDLKGIFSVDVVVHRQHGDVEAGQQNAAKYPLLFLICTGKQNKSTSCSACKNTSWVIINSCTHAWREIAWVARCEKSDALVRWAESNQQKRRALI